MLLEILIDPTPSKDTMPSAALTMLVPTKTPPLRLGLAPSTVKPLMETLLG